MPRKGSTRWRRSSHARRSSRRRTTARFPHRGAIRGCGAAVMADERAPREAVHRTKPKVACRLPRSSFTGSLDAHLASKSLRKKKGAVLRATRWKHRARLLLPAAQRSAGPPMLRSPRTGAWGANEALNVVSFVLHIVSYGMLHTSD